MTEAPDQKANTVAFELALAAIVRVIVGELCMRPDPKEFRVQMQKFEDIVVQDISRMSVQHVSNEYTDTYVREAAAGWASRFFAGIRHPKDN